MLFWCPNPECVDGKVTVEIPRGGTMTTACATCQGFGRGRGGIALEIRANPATKAKRKRPRRARSPRTVRSSRTNPPASPLPPAAAAALLKHVRAGVRVRLLVPNGIGRRGVEWKAVTGRAVMPAAGGGWVVNLGGAHGRPGIVTAANIVDVLGASRTNPAAASASRETHSVGGQRGHLVGCDVFAIEYANVGSKTTAAYRHDFDSKGVQLWALADGSLLIRHPRYRLWDEFTVSDKE